MSVIEQSIRERIADILGVPSSKVDSSKSLAGLGLDSLGLLQLTASIESDFGEEWPGGSSDQITIGFLAELLEERCSAIPARIPGLRERLRADALLPPEIVPHGTSVCVPRCVLLTGATGFLGAYLLRSLLTESEIEAVCLVRPGREPGFARIRRNLMRYGIWEERFADRIHVLIGDLSQPRLGVSELEFERIAAHADAILHSAALVNWVQQYSTLRSANVLAVRELLRLACCSKPKPFHLVSTLSVCYSTDGPRDIDETSDLFANIDGIHLAYAQSKLVGESLVRSAAQRGLPCRIYRPSFISGDSISGISNTSDFMSALIKGCVQMAAAPDLDWSLDAVPVDFTASAISRLLLANAPAGFEALHLANPQTRHWREMILWMKLYGYSIELLPYREWLAQLEREIAAPDHPLRSLAPFFLQQPPGLDGVYLPQLYEEGCKARVDTAHTLRVLAECGMECPRLSADLLERYFSSFIAQQFLSSPPQGTRRSDSGPRMDRAFFRRVFPQCEILGINPQAFPARHSVMGELTSWRCGGETIGLHGYRITLEEKGKPVERDVIVKVKGSATDVQEIGEAMAALCSTELGDAFKIFSHLLDLNGSDRRELALYSHASERIQRYTPQFYGGWTENGHTCLVLEKLSSMAMMNSIECLDDWQPEHVYAAIDGLAEMHAAWYGRAECPENMLLQPYATTAEMQSALPLWTAMSACAAPLFSQWAGERLCALHNHLIDTLGEWWPATTELPRTVIHNDFNPRNLAFRVEGGRLRLCVYDWELAKIGLPQHDLAELLCFVLGPQVTAHDLHHYLQRSRGALKRATGAIIDDDAWLEGFRLSLCDLIVNRLPAYAMISRFRRQNFLERAVRSWLSLYDAL